MKYKGATIEAVALAKLAPYARNARTHSDAQVAEIAASLEQFGMVGAVIVRDGVIAKGHGTLAAIRAIYARGGRLYPAPGQAAGATPYPDGTAPVLDVSGWTDTQFRAYVIADNQLALNAGWDEALLGLEVRELTALGIDNAILGFDANRLDALLAEPIDPADAAQDRAEDTPPLEAQVIAQAGDVWLLGPHRLACGNSTAAADVAALLAGATPRLMVTDPPYGVEYDADWRNHTGDLGRSARAVGKVLNDDRADWREAWALFRGDVAYVWHAPTRASEVDASLAACGLEIRAQIIWAKSQLVISRGAYHPQHEPCWYAVRKGATASWNGSRKETTLWSIDKPRKSETGHSTQKPLECMQRPIENHTHRGDAVYDPFVGSGTTLMACEATGRHCLALELNPAYVDVTIRRWQTFTGQRATLERTGESFPAPELEPAAA